MSCNSTTAQQLQSWRRWQATATAKAGRDSGCVCYVSCRGNCGITDSRRELAGGPQRVPPGGQRKTLPWRGDTKPRTKTPRTALSSGLALSANKLDLHEEITRRAHAAQWSLVDSHNRKTGWESVTKSRGNRAPGLRWRKFWRLRTPSWCGRCNTSRLCRLNRTQRRKRLISCCSNKPKLSQPAHQGTQHSGRCRPAGSGNSSRFGCLMESASVRRGQVHGGGQRREHEHGAARDGEAPRRGAAAASSRLVCCTGREREKGVPGPVTPQSSIGDGIHGSHSGYSRHFGGGCFWFYCRSESPRSSMASATSRS